MTTKSHRVKHLLSSEPRWRAIDERERENLLQDFLDELLLKEKENIRNERLFNKVCSCCLISFSKYII